jgi:hypothetical protein
VENSFPKDGQQSLKKSFQQSDSTSTTAASNINTNKLHINNMQLKMNNLSSEDLPVSLN